MKLNRIIEVAQEIKDARLKVNKLETELAQLVGGGATTNRRQYKRKFSKEGITAKVYEAVAAFKGEKLTGKDVANLLHINERRASKLLWNLARQRRIRALGQGSFCAKLPPTKGKTTVNKTV